MNAPLRQPLRIQNAPDTITIRPTNAIIGAEIDGVDLTHPLPPESVALIRAALEYASARGARIVEAYPVIPKSGKAADVFIYTGTLSAFERAGFSVAARPSPSRAIVRYRIGGTE